MSDTSDRARDLAAFANAGGQPNQPMGSSAQPPGGHSLVRPTHGLSEQVIGAQPVHVYRDERKILDKLRALAAAAGSDWFYRFPVRKKEGGQDWIEGPSIKLANDVARIFGNNVNEVRELDVGDAWVFYARFTDLETGFSMERAYRQRKSQGSMKTRDADRQLDIAYQIGQSKAIRNCIVNALQIYADFAFEEARNSLVEKIGKDLVGWRERTLQSIAKMGVDLVRVERVIGRASKDWLAPNIAQIVAMGKSVADGMASVDDVFPPIEAPAESTQSARSDTNIATPRGEGGERGAAAPTPATEPAEASDLSAADSAPLAADVITLAYDAGRKARAAGHQRRAVPGEYREPARSKEADAWLRGWDGQEKPML